MRLHKHEELVEAMARAACRADGLAWGAISSTLRLDYLKNAAAALDAMLEAVVELDVGGLVPVVKSINPERYGKQLVIELAEKQP